MFRLAAEAGVPYIIMHMQGTPSTMQDNPHYTDVVAEIKSFLLERAALAREAGVRQENLVIDPGIGFGKSKRDNLDIIMHLDSFTESGYKVLLGASRKRFMGSICDITELQRTGRSNLRHHGNRRLCRDQYLPRTRRKGEPPGPGRSLGASWQAGG